MDAPASDAIIVTKVVTNGPRRKLFLSTGDTLELHRFASVGLGDKIRIAGSSTSRRVTVPCLNGDAQIVPSFTTSTHVPGLSQSVHVKEVETADELAAYERLGGYHY